MRKALILAVLAASAAGVGILQGGSSLYAQAGPSGAQAASGPACDPNIFIGLAKRAIPSVVNISTSIRLKGPRMGGGSQEEMFRRFFEDMFRQYGGRGTPQGPEDGEEDEAPIPPGGKGPRSYSLGTGFIIDASGLILTNNHVVAEADEIKIQFTEEAGEEPADGEVVGRDHDLDLALIKVKTKRTLVPVTFGDSDALEVGEYVIAVGNPFGQGHSVTHGIISAKGRKAPDFMLANYLQTDAPINPGNSGGPLLNLRGEVIGINNAIDQRAQGIGFAIPVNLVKSILPQLKSKGSVSRGYIGVVVNELTPEIAEKLKVAKGLKAPFVTQTYPDEPAEKAGLKPYDVILEFNGKKVTDSASLVGAVTASTVGQSVPIKISRAGEEKTLQISVSRRPNGVPSKARKEDPVKKGSKKPARIDVGMDLDDLTPEIAKDIGLPVPGPKEKLTGVVVSNLSYEGPAAAAGLGRGDVIVEVDRQPVTGVDEFFSIVKSKKSYLLRVRRVDAQGRDVFSVVVLDLKS